MNNSANQVVKFIKEKRANGLTEKTIRNYQQSLEMFFNGYDEMSKENISVFDGTC